MLAQPRPVVAPSVRRLGVPLALGAGVAGPVLFVGTDLVVAASGGAAFDPVRHTISQLIHAPAGGLLPPAFVQLGGAMLLLAWALGRRVDARTRAVLRWGLGTLGATMITIAAIPADAPGTIPSAVDAVHGLLVAAAGAVFVLSSHPLARALGGEPALRHLARPTRIVGGAVLVLGIGMYTVAFRGPLQPWRGAEERLGAGILLAWMIALAIAGLRAELAGERGA